ncbi:MAG: ADP-dependent NAD(P)H-hydrate dehydratase [Actinomycetota bacterium]|jgi:NAD(P)H-hydrate repair Nnr-like enzyme with NAD(P)H-hydrate dehydratase domain
MTPLDELLEANPLPAASGGKDDKGTILVIGGPPSCPGAALLTGEAALRTGSGRVQLCVAPSVAAEVAVALREAAVYAWDLTGDPSPEVSDAIERADVIVIGVGHTHVPASAVDAVAQRSSATLVLDAGALHVATELARDHTVVIAPNAAEAAELLASDETDETQLAEALCDRLGQPVAVRGTIAVVAADDGPWSYDELPDGLGTPGSGDVFIGALAAVLAKGCKTTAALGWAIALHARAAGRLAACTPVGYLAGEIARELPHALAG